MEPVTERDIRSSFINCSKGDAKRLPVPRDLDDRPWDDLDFLGWSDPSFPGRCYVVVPRDGRLVGVALRYETGGYRRAQMCTVCMTTHANGGVSLMTARKSGESGRRGNSIGTYMRRSRLLALRAPEEVARTGQAVPRGSRTRGEDRAGPRQPRRLHLEGLRLIDPTPTRHAAR